jgi:hypothetical protein
MSSKVSSEWLPSYIKVTPPVLEIFKMAGNIPERPRILPRLTLQKKLYMIYREDVTCRVFSTHMIEEVVYQMY